MGGTVDTVTIDSAPDVPVFRLAWLGDNPGGLPLLAALVREANAKLVSAAECGALTAALTQIDPGVRIELACESLLPLTLDAVVVAGDSEATLQGARRLAQQGAAVLVDTEAAPALQLFSELTALDVERPLKIVPAFRMRGLAAVQALGSLLTAGVLTAPRRARFERRFAGRAFELTTEVLDGHLFQDVDLLRALLGRFDQVTAFRHFDSAGHISLATATLAGAELPPVAWSVTPGSEAGWRLTIEGEPRTAVIDVDRDGARLQLDGVLARDSVCASPMEEGARLVALEFARGLSAGSAGRPGPSQSQKPAMADWNDLIRDVEILDAVGQSVRRRRTIDILSESPSERGLFKSQMTAVGCLLLILTPMGVVLYLVIAAAIDLPGWLKTGLVVAVFAPLGLFLVSQTLVFIAHPPPAEEGPRSGHLEDRLDLDRNSRGK